MLDRSEKRRAEIGSAEENCLSVSDEATCLLETSFSSIPSVVVGKSKSESEVWAELVSELKAKYKHSSAKPAASDDPQPSARVAATMGTKQEVPQSRGAAVGRDSKTAT